MHHSIANMARLGVIPEYTNLIELTVLPTVVKLCGDPDMDVRARASAVLGVSLSLCPSPVCVRLSLSDVSLSLFVRVRVVCPQWSNSAATRIWT